MVFCPIPSQQTDEEKFLQQKYLKLKKKKKLLQQQLTPKQEPNQTVTITNKQNPLKRGIDGGPPKQDAKELAKKLIKSGAISAIKPPEKEKQGFKRSKTLQRKKLEQTDKPKYQPFSAVYKPDHLSSLDGENSGSNRSAMFDSITGLPTKEKEAIAREETFREKRRDGKAHYVNRDIPSNVGTIYVHGIGLTEPMLKNAFMQFGNIIKISCELSKNCGFVTFESIDQANRAIDTMNGSQIQNITLKVSLARKQPFINKPGQATEQPTVENQTSSPTSTSTASNTTANSNNLSATSQTTTATSSSSLPQQQQQSSSFNSSANDWSSIAASYEHKNKPAKDKRQLIAYDDIF